MFCFVFFDRISLRSPGGPRTYAHQAGLKIRVLLYYCWDDRHKPQGLAQKMIKTSGQGNMHLTDDELKKLKGSRDL